MRARHATHLGERDRGVGDVLEHLDAADHVKLASPKWQVVDAAGGKRQVGACALGPLGREVGIRKVQADHARLGQRRGPALGHDPFAAPDVEQRVRVGAPRAAHRHRARSRPSCAAQADWMSRTCRSSCRQARFFAHASASCSPPPMSVAHGAVREMWIVAGMPTSAVSTTVTVRSITDAASPIVAEMPSSAATPATPPSRKPSPPGMMLSVLEDRGKRAHDERRAQVYRRRHRAKGDHELEADEATRATL